MTMTLMNDLDYFDPGEFPRLVLSGKQIRGALQNIIRQMIDDNYKPEYIVGISRGGLIPSVMLSHYLSIPMHSLRVSFHNTSERESNLWMAEDALNNKNILIIDDACDSGDTFNWIKKDWAVNDQWHNTIKCASLIKNVTNTDKIVDYYGMKINLPETTYPRTKEEIPYWLVFPWECWWEN